MTSREPPNRTDMAHDSLIPQSNGSPTDHSRESMSEGQDSATQAHASLPNLESAVAVIGLACRFPGSDSLDEFWDVLESGSSMHQELPKDRFPDARFSRRGHFKQFRGNLMNNVDSFDHKFFKVSSREATYMDPQQRLALEVAYQTLESAGYFTREYTEDEREIGCYMACCANEYSDNVATHPPSAFSCTGTVRPFIAGKVSHQFGFTGPTMMFDAACAASGVAIHQACRAVASGECVGALAGGTNVFISPDIFENLAGGHFLSSTGASKSFDASADGYCRGEGVAMVFLKKLSAAIRDGDHIRGVIAATAVNQCSNEVSITIPHGPSQMKLYRKALQISGFSPHDVTYVEAHGTGTPVGDPIEAESIRRVFGDPSRANSVKTYMGSIKSNIGHTEASSGISALIKVLLMMQKGAIPQQALFRTLNPGISPLEADGMAIPTKTIPWTADFKVACVNNYGASGTNAVFVVTEPPKLSSHVHGATITHIPIPAWPVTISAFTESSLKAYCSALLRFVDKSTSPKNEYARNISHYLSQRRNLSLPYSICATISSLQDLKNLLETTMRRDIPKRQTKSTPTVLFFGGQTGKPINISRTIYDSLHVFRKHLDECDGLLEEFGAPRLYPSIFDRGQVDDLVLSHAMLFSEQYASAMAWLDCGMRPARVIGHSFGQYTAMCVSGSLSLRDGLRLVVERARLIQKHWGNDPGSMIAVEADKAWVTNLLAKEAQLGLEIACHNGPRSFVLAGSTAAADALEPLLTSSNAPIRWKRLEITHAFHTALAEPMLAPFEQSLKQISIQPPKIPVETCSEEDTWESITPALLASHNRDTVFFYQAVQRISKQLGPCTWLEAGSGNCASVLRRSFGASASAHSIISLNLGTQASLDQLATITSELWKLSHNVQFWPFHHSQQHQYSAINLPPYQFDKARHWLEWKELGTPMTEIPRQAAESTPLLQVLSKMNGRADLSINTQTPEWESLCTGNLVLGVAVCPASSLQVLITKAIDLLRDDQAHESPTYDIQELRLHIPIPATPANGLHLRIVENGSNFWTFAVASSDKSEHLYSSGAVVNTVGMPGTAGHFSRLERLLDTSPIKNLKDDLETDSVRGKAVYQGLKSICQVPKSKQVVREVMLRGNEAAALMMPQSAGRFLFEESILQVPTVCLNSLHEREDDEIYVHTAIGRTEYKHLPGNSSETHDSHLVYLKLFGLGGAEVTCDIFVFDSKSETLVSVILDIAFVKVQVGVFRQALDGSITQILPPSSAGTEPTETRENIKLETQPVKRLDVLDTSHAMLQTAGLPDLTKALYELLVRVADVEMDALHHSALFVELGVDSLMGMEVAEEINNFFSVDIDVQEFAAATDVGSLCRLVASRAKGYCFDSETSSVTGSDSQDDSVSASSASVSEESVTDISSHDQEPKMLSGSFVDFSSSKSFLSAAREAFDSVRDDFDIYAKETGCDRFYSDVYPHQAKLVISYITEAFSKLGCDLSTIQAGAKIPLIPHAERYSKLMTQLMGALREGDLIAWDGSAWIRTPTPFSGQPTSRERFDRIQADFPQFASEHVLLDAVGKQLHESLSGKVNPVALLFGTAAKRQLMAEQYLKAPMQCSVSQQLLSFIKKCFGSLKTTRVLRVLEIGGGTCGTTLHVVKAFSELAIPVEYTFSDISASFVTGAKSKLANYDFIKYRTLDITKEPPADMIEHYDMVIATNVIHATPDVSTSARTVRRMLRPDGFITFVEYTESLYWGDIVFGQFEGWWVFDDGRKHAIMNEHGWNDTLQRAGFQKVDWTRGSCESATIVKIFLAS